VEAAVVYNSTLSAHQRFTVFLHALLFVLGFTLIFVVGWGGAATLAGELFAFYRPILAKVGGAVIILFGLSNLGLIKMRWLMYDTRPQWQAQKKNGLFASGMMGVFFAAGWTPCLGTTLGAILTLAITQETQRLALVLSAAYAVGLGLPFLLIGLSMDRAAGIVARFRRSMRWIQKASGVFLLVIGVMMLTNQLFYISIWAQRNGFFLDLPLGGAAVPSLLIALFAGLISFLSPCVLPLVPAYIGYLSGHAFQRPAEAALTPGE
jgi:cytochrome c-type biogenesis protein